VLTATPTNREGEDRHRAQKQQGERFELVLTSDKRSLGPVDRNGGPDVGRRDERHVVGGGFCPSSGTGATATHVEPGTDV